MKTDKLLITTNMDEIMKAEKLGYATPAPIQKETCLMFRIGDVKTAVLDADNHILMEMYDESQFEIAFDKELWGKIWIHFIDDNA